MASWNAGEAVVDPGMVTEADSEVGQLVSEPTGTSEYWYANCAVDAGATENDEGGAFAALEIVTVRPLTIVTVSGAPLPEKSAMVAYPSTVHDDAPVLVTVITPVIVPAAP
jgi:hypothetical protein